MYFGVGAIRLCFYFWEGLDYYVDIFRMTNYGWLMLWLWITSKRYVMCPIKTNIVWAREFSVKLQYIISYMHTVFLYFVSFW